MMKKLVFATNNPHKLEEIRAIAGNRFQILSLADINCHDDIPETAPDLTGNALIKARWVRDRYGFDCFADDTGLMVDALDGRPGVYSARYAGPECSPDDNMHKLLDEMKDLNNREAHFETVIALCLDGKEHTFSGRVDGEIATSRHGSAGFGYDPIFIPDMLPGHTPGTEIPNSEKLSFAEIPAEKKNAISHRGKATKALISFLMMLLALILPQKTFAATDPAGIWTYHPSIGREVNRVFSTPNYLYLVNLLQPYHPKTDDIQYLTPYSVIFKYDKKEGELTTLTKNSGLSSYPPTITEYNPDRRYLFIGYEDGNIDLLFDNGKVVNIPALKNADNITDKTINSVTFDPEASTIYVATNFGYFTIDDRKNEVIESKIYRVPLTSVAKAGRYIVAADTAGLVYSAPVESQRLQWSEFSKLPKPSATVYQLLPLGGDLCGAMGSDRSARTLMLINPETPEIRDLRVMYNTSLQFTPERTYFIGSSNRGIILQSDGTIKMITIPEPEINAPTPMASWDLNEFWFVDDDNRFYSRRRTDNNGTDSWSNPTAHIGSQGPIPFRVTDMIMHPTYGILVSNHGTNTAFSSNKHPIPLELSAYKNGGWTQYGLKQRMPEQLLAFGDPNGMAIDPDNTDVLYLGSMLYGMYRMNLADKSSVIHWSRPDPDWQDLPGYIKVHDSFPDWERLSQLSYPVIDNQGNLWVVYNNFKKSDKIKFPTDIVTELWVLPADQRRATTSASSARPFTKIPVRNMIVNEASRLLPLKHSSNNNLIVYTDGQAKSNIVVYDYKGTAGNTSDDKMASFQLNSQNLEDSEGGKVEKTYVTALFEDPETGLIWVGTESGIFSFSPTGLLAGDSQLRQFKIARNDGTGLADYLLTNVKVYDITVDKRNRKWISTQGAGLVCVSADGTEILTECNTGNSDIPSDVVYTTLYLPEENAMMVATESGLAHYQPYNIGDGTDFEYARAYPNPVRPDYLGYVTIDGLADNALVKISDAHGRLVRELGFATNGMVRWDVSDMQHQRVGSGVYFVLASTGPDDQSLSKVTKILVVN